MADNTATILPPRNPNPQEEQGNAEHDSSKLAQEFTGVQIFFIILSLVIGSGIFTNNGEVLKIAGPYGLLFAVVIFGSVAVCVGETVGELVQLFPVPNAIFEYVSAFVDKDVAWGVAILYWFAYASIFPYQVLAVARILHFWVPMNPWPRVLATCLPVLLFFLNVVHVKLFGWIETISGAIKLTLVFVVSILMFIVASKDENWHFYHNSDFANGDFEALCLGLPMVAFSFVGIEGIVMAAFETRRTSLPSLRVVSQLTHWIIYVFYILCTLGIILTVNWQDPALPLTYDPAVGAPPGCGNPRTRSAVVIGMAQGLHAFGRDWAGPCHRNDAPPPAAHAVNGILLFATVSAANASLYVASRTLYGLTYGEDKGVSFVKSIKRWLRRHTGSVTEYTGAPTKALFVTVVAWYFLIGLDFGREKGNQGVTDFMYVIAVSQSVSVLLVWAALCLAYLRLQSWTKKYPTLAQDDPDIKGCVRSSREYKATTFLSGLQPWTACYAFLSCLAVFVLISATMWKRGATATKFMAAYLPHILLVIIVFSRKVFLSSSQGWFRLGTKADLLKRLRRLTTLYDEASKQGQQPAPDGGAYEMGHLERQRPSDINGQEQQRPQPEVIAEQTNSRAYESRELRTPPGHRI
ncbi:hypothetical protein RB600_006860 [Gaeumannomyces tritici]